MKANSSIVFLICFMIITGCASAPSGLAEEYRPVINPEEFTSVIDNQYFPLIPGTVTFYEGLTEEGTEIIIVEVTHETREVMGITCVVVRDRVWLNGELVEDTDDWYAQDADGNVWYMGEISKEYKNGQIASYKGSWEAGVEGAMPGIIVHANPRIGIPYYQEYREGEAEDMAKAVSVNETVTTPYGTYQNCLQLLEWNPLEINSAEYKYLAPGVGVVKEVAGIEEIVLVEAIAQDEVDAYIKEVENREYKVPLGLATYIEAGVEDVNDDERSFYVKPGVEWEVFKTGISVSIEGEFPLIPETELGFITMAEDYEYESEDIPIIISAGNENSINPEAVDESEGQIYAALSFFEIFTLELDFIYMTDIELITKTILGYEFDFGRGGILETEAGVNFLLYEDPGFGDVEFNINYSYIFGIFTLTAGIEPVIEIENQDDRYEGNFLMTPYIIGTFTF